jgi:flagellar biosynthesis protein FlhF
VDHLVERAMDASNNLDMLTELRSIRQMLDGMMITRPEGLDVTLGHAAPVRLHQAGFSSRAIQQLHHHMVGLDDDEAVAAFINALAKRVVHRDAESVFDSRVVFVVGSSGTGKTTLATKIAAYFKEHGISERMMLTAATGPGISANEDIKSYARLLNMRTMQLGIGEVPTAIMETSNRLIIDVNASPEDTDAAIRQVIQRLGSSKVTVVQAIPGGSSATMIGHQCRLHHRLKPMIALTKLDECEAMPAELSALALDGTGVGLLTGTKSIVGGIAIATRPILAQYLQENAAK